MPGRSAAWSLFFCSQSARLGEIPVETWYTGGLTAPSNSSGWRPAWTTLVSSFISAHRRGDALGFVARNIGLQHGGKLRSCAADRLCALLKLAFTSGRSRILTGLVG